MEPQQLHTIAALLVAVLSVLFVIGRIGGKFLDDWWDRGKPKNANGNGNSTNGDTRKICFLGEDGVNHMLERLDAHHDRLREAIHQNHASTIALLSQLANNLDARRETEKEIAITLRLIERHMAEGRK